MESKWKMSQLVLILKTRMSLLQIFRKVIKVQLIGKIYTMRILNIISPTEATFITLNEWLSQCCKFKF